MDEGVFIALLFAATFSGVLGCFTGFMWGKARASRQFLERWGDALLSRSRPADPGAVPAADTVRRIATSVDHLGERFELMEQRLDFAERLLDRERAHAPPPPQLPR